MASFNCVLPGQVQAVSQSRLIGGGPLVCDGGGEWPCRDMTLKAGTLGPQSSEIAVTTPPSLASPLLLCQSLCAEKELPNISPRTSVHAFVQ